MHSPRYIPLVQRPDRDSPDGGAEGTIFRILDTWYCHREVYRAASTGKGAMRAERIQPRFHRTLNEWNAEHEAWLAEC